jgi:soluble lytic murein transglycosylase-like protein
MMGAKISQKLADMRAPAIGAALLSSVLAAPAEAGDIYRYVDRNGNIHYTNVPNDSRYKVHRRIDNVNPVTQTLTVKTRYYSQSVRKRYQKDIESAARRHNVDPALIHAVISAESGYNPFARSQAGAAGLMQLMPETAKRFGARNRLDPAENIHAGTRYLRVLMDLFNNDLELVLAAYNAGENAVIRAGHRVPPYEETMTYVPRVLRYYQNYRTRM